MGIGISDLKVSYAKKNPEVVHNVVVCFGQGNELEVDNKDGKAWVHLRNTTVQVSLEAEGMQSAFERAINLLRLHLTRY